MIKKFRGHVVDALAIICGVLAYLQTAGITTFLPPKLAWIPIALGAANIVLHGVLSTLARKPPEQS
jgi:hypothetical protein